MPIKSKIYLKISLEQRAVAEFTPVLIVPVVKVFFIVLDWLLTLLVKTVVVDNEIVEYFVEVEVVMGLLVLFDVSVEAVVEEELYVLVLADVFVEVVWDVSVLIGFSVGLEAEVYVLVLFDVSKDDSTVEVDASVLVLGNVSVEVEVGVSVKVLVLVEKIVVDKAEP